MKMKPRVLLTANYGPNELAWGEDMYDVIASRLGRGQWPFQVTSHCHYFALYLIAENITNPTTVLENPHWDEFDRELDVGYDIVGFQLKSLHTAKIAQMMKHIREKSPDTKIVIGGYGVSTLDAPVPGDTNGDAAYIRDNADYLCREEGVQFMRRLLGDEPIDREITQYHLPMAGFSSPGLDTHARQPMILASLGCPGGCDFCNTSAFFRRKKTYVAEPEQVYRYAKHYMKRLNSDGLMFMLYDEDLYSNPEYVRELGRLIRSDRKTWGITYSSFGGVRSLSRFDPEELRDCGVGAVWVGVESFLSGEGLTDSQYTKRKGKDLKELFESLHRNGIQTIGSLVLGFDFHTRENLKEDIDKFVALKPGAYQISPLTPCPGTALYERLTREGRILHTYRWEDFHLWKDDVYQPKNLELGEIREFFDYAHQQLRDVNGPQTLEVLENALDCYQLLKDRTDEYHQFQAEGAKQTATWTSAYLRAIRLHHQSEQVRQRAKMLEKRFNQEIGSAPQELELASLYLSDQMKSISQKPRPPVISDPPPRWTYYHTFDDRVWVRKGREAKEPVLYEDPRPAGSPLLQALRG